MGEEFLIASGRLHYPMLKQFRPAALAATSGLVLSACQKSIAREPPCPPGPFCEDSTPVWPILGPVAIGVVAVAFAVAVSIKPRGEEPAFIPYRRSVLGALGLGAAAAILFAVAAREPDLFYAAWVGFGATLGAFLLGGTSLRPRGSRVRGLALGAFAYAISGVVSVVIVNQGFIEDLDLVGWALQVVTWPGLLFVLQTAS